MKKSTMLALAAAGVVGTSAVFGSQVFAHGGREAKLNEQAEWLGISADQLRQELQGGKDFKEVAEAHGKSEEDIKSHREEARSQHRANKEKRHEERKASLTAKLKEAGFSDEQVNNILEVLESERPQPKEDMPEQN